MSKNIKEYEYTYIKNKENMEKFFKTNLFNELAKEKDLQQIKNIINYCWYDDKNKIFYVKKGDLPQYLIKNFYNLKEKIEAKKITKFEIINSDRKPIQNAEKIYWDPDRVDENLYSTFINKNHLQYNPYIDKNYTRNKCHFQSSKNTNIKLALDAVIGWKAIMDILFEENNKIEDIKKVTEIYQIIRNPENGGHLIWPQYRGNTINTSRYGPSKRYYMGDAFKDRIDYTLFDIKKYYEANGNKSKIEKLVLKKAYFAEDTKKWLNSFNGGFNEFIIKMNLSRWCLKDKNGNYVIDKNGNYEVLDLSEDIKKFENKKPIKNYLPALKDGIDNPNICKMPRKNKNGTKIYGYNYPVTKEYLYNVIDIISNNKTNGQE